MPATSCLSFRTITPDLSRSGLLPPIVD
jgi:hypothetical protein